MWEYHDVAILVRANDDADPFLRSLNLYGVPWRFSGSRGLYSLSEIRQLIAFLHILADPHHSIYLHSLACSPLYGIPMADLTQCNRLCRRQHVSLYTLFQRFNAPDHKSESHNPQSKMFTDGPQPSTLDSQLSIEGQVTMAKLIEDISTYQEYSRNHSVGVVLYESLLYYFMNFLNGVDG